MRIPPPTTAVLLAALSAAFPLRAEETAGLPEEPSAPVVAEAVTDTVATGTNLPRLIEPVTAPEPVPAPAVKPYAPDPAGIRGEQTVEQGGRHITYQRMEPLPVPPPPGPVPQPTAAERAAFAARVAELRATRPRERFILLGGTLYLSDDRPPRALCRQWPAGGGEPVTFWTNIDLRDIRGLGRFAGTDGTIYHLCMMWSVVDLSRAAAAWAAKGRDYRPPALPDFPNETTASAGQPAALTGAATFIPLPAADAKPADLGIITELHKIHNQERARLHAAAVTRENARLAAEAELKATPPAPQDITLRYWLKTTARRVPAGPAPAQPAAPPPSAPSASKPRRPSRRVGVPPTKSGRPSESRVSPFGRFTARFFRIFSVSAFQLLLLSLPASAIWDTNGNGVSDAWELNTNNGQLLPAYTPGADPDSDGWTNEAESAAGTHPGNPAPPAGRLLPESRLTPETHILHEDGSVVTIPGSIVLTWTGIPGKRYTLQHSVDLATWTSVGDAVISDGTPIEAGVVIGETGRHFLRVRVDDYDSDSDGLDDYEELRLGTRSDSSDTDGDGKTDHSEANNPDLYDPRDPDQDLDGIPDGADTSPRSNNVDPSPDTAGLIDPATGNPTALLTSMAGRWDLERIETVGAARVFKDSTAGGRHATPVAILSADPEGMISKCARTNILPTAGYLHVPATLLDNKTQYSVSFWANIEAGSVRNNPGRPAGLYGHSQYMPFTGQTPHNWNCLTIETNGIWLEMAGGVSRLHAGRYSYVNHVNGVRHTPSVATYGIDIPRTLDDGTWHHYLMTMSGAIVTLYIDGVQAGSASYTNPPINGAPFTTVSLGRLYGPDPGLSPTPPPPVDTKTRGRVDRLRVWHSVLTSADALTLHREDADHDGLWDVTEAGSSLWRDANSDAIRTSSEVAFYVDPFRFDPPGKDHDRDGIASVSEQTLGTGIYDADSDDDGIPDGYDQQWCAGAKTPDTNLPGDTDGDGLTLAMEIAYGTNPNDADSDGDGTNDGPEYAQGSHPNDASDGGQRPAAGATIPMKLAVGDQSGSESEDYHLVAYRYDPETKQETEVYRLRSGGFGQYSGEQTVSGVFRADETHTFRIQWQGTNLNTRPAAYGITAEGPDFDYSMIVEPAAPVPGLVIEDAIIPATGDLYPGPGLLGDHSDVTGFPGISYEAAVKASMTYIDLAVDTNMDGRIDSLPDNSPATATKTFQGRPPLDSNLEKADATRPVIIDVNNNNDDAKAAESPGKFQVDNENTFMDGVGDLNDLTNKANGHCFGKLRVWANPLARLKDGKVRLRLSYADANQGSIVRVFDWRTPGTSGDAPQALLDSSNANAMIDNTLFCDDLGTGPKSSYRDLVMEGLTYGTATIRLELLDTQNNDAVIATDEIHVTVNVDQYARSGAANIQASPDGLPIRGENPHYAGIFGIPLVSQDQGVRALRGKISVRMPAANDKGLHGYLTQPCGRSPRTYEDNNLGDISSGAAFWVGLREDLGGGKMTWTQCGVRWLHPAKALYTSEPFAYLENGAFISAGKSHLRELAAPYAGVMADGGLPASNKGSKPLQGWHNEQLQLDFVLYKRIVNQTNGNDSTPEKWRVLFLDARPGRLLAKENIIDIAVKAPTPNSNAALSDSFVAHYCAQKLNLLDSKFETNHSIAFAPGTATQNASISELKWASGLVDGVSLQSMPSESDVVELWKWLIRMDRWNWQDVPDTSSACRMEIRTGRNTGTGPETATPKPTNPEILPHPYWRLEAISGGFKTWDSRTHGFLPRN